MAVILCFTRLETIILCSPPLLWQTARASAEMISNRFSKMLSTRLPPYIISFQWAENKNLIHKSIATSIRCTLVHILFCSIKILYCLYPLRSVYIDGCAAGRRLTRGSMGVKRHLALWEGNLVSGALMIMASVKRALPDLAPLAVAPCQAPWIVGQTERGGGCSLGRRGGTWPLGCCPGWTPFPPDSFYSGAVPYNWDFLYPRNWRHLVCQPRSLE